MSHTDRRIWKDLQKVHLRHISTEHLACRTGIGSTDGDQSGHACHPYGSLGVSQ